MHMLLFFLFYFCNFAQTDLDFDSLEIFICLTMAYGAFCVLNISTRGERLLHVCMQVSCEQVRNNNTGHLPKYRLHAFQSLRVQLYLQLQVAADWRSPPQSQTSQALINITLADSCSFQQRVRHWHPCNTRCTRTCMYL